LDRSSIKGDRPRKADINIGPIMREKHTNVWEKGKRNGVRLNEGGGRGVCVRGELRSFFWELVLRKKLLNEDIDHYLPGNGSAREGFDRVLKRGGEGRFSGGDCGKAIFKTRLSLGRLSK